MQEDRNLVELVERLQADRRRHAEAIEAINKVLVQVSRTVASFPVQVNEDVQLERSLVKPPPHSRRQKFKQTGEGSVLEFIRQRGNPTTAEINQHWKSEGRRGVANVILLRLLKQKAIFRQIDPSVRGSRYSANPAVNQPQPPHAATSPTP